MGRECGCFSGVGMGMREGALTGRCWGRGKTLYAFKRKRSWEGGKLRLHLPHGLVGVILSLFHRRHRSTEGFGNLLKDTQLM